MHQDYKNPVLRWLRDRQLSAAREEMLSQIEAAERLLLGLDPKASYPAAQVVSQIVGESLPEAGNRKISSADLLHDLRRFVEDLSDAVELNAEAVGEPVFTVDQTGQTIQCFDQNDFPLACLGDWSAGDWFSMAANGSASCEAASISSSKTTRCVLSVVPSLASSPTTSGPSSSTVPARWHKPDRARPKSLASWPTAPGRSIETIRAALKQHDTDNPGIAIFPAGSGPLTDVQKENIFRAHRRGMSIDKLCSDYSRTKTTIYRVVNEMRAAAIAELPLEFMPNPRFARKGADKACLGPMPEAEKATRKAKRPAGLPPYLASLYEHALLTREQEQHLFRKYNYLKFKASRLRDQLDIEHPKATVMDEIEQLHEQIVDCKKPDRPLQPATGRVDRQEACYARPKLFRAGL